MHFAKYIKKCPGGGTGIHSGLKIRAIWHAGSIPAPGTLFRRKTPSA